MSYLVGRDEPSHFSAGGQLAINETLDLILGPSVVDVHDGNHVPLKGNRIIKLPSTPKRLHSGNKLRSRIVSA
jgi:hypothetical protein